MCIKVLDEIRQWSSCCELAWRHMKTSIHVGTFNTRWHQSVFTIDQWQCISQNIREVYRFIAAADSECQTYFRARMCPHTHMPSLSAELAALQRWPRCHGGNVRPHLNWPQCFLNPLWLPRFPDPTTLADISTSLLHTQPISIELSLTHFAHSLMKQGNRWSAFNEIRVGLAPLNHLSRLKARGLLTCHCAGYTKPDTHPRLNAKFRFFFFKPCTYLHIWLLSQTSWISCFSKCFQASALLEMHWEDIWPFGAMDVLICTLLLGMLVHFLGLVRISMCFLGVKLISIDDQTPMKIWIWPIGAAHPLNNG